MTRSDQQYNGAFTQQLKNPKNVLRSFIVVMDIEKLDTRYKTIGEKNMDQMNSLPLSFCLSFSVYQCCFLQNVLCLPKRECCRPQFWFKPF